MASPADLNPKSRTGDEYSVDIKKLLTTDESEGIQHSQGVCVCKVPKSLKAAKPEAFIPHFVGLGPYHHDRPDLILTEKMKLGAAKRVLQLPLDVLEPLFNEFQFTPVPDIRGYYHVDVNDKHPDRNQLLLMLKFDALFLLGLLVLIHRFAPGSRNPQEHTHSYFLTGKDGMPLLNYAGVELTIDAIIRDVLMLENQIPTHFLNQIAEVLFLSKSQEFHAREIYEDPGSTMKKFCEDLCPFEKPEELSKNIKEHHHLLDLMYSLTVPKPEPEPQPPSQDQGSPKSINKCCCVCCGIFIILAVVCYLFYFIVMLIFKLTRPIVECLYKSQIPGTERFRPLLGQIMRTTDEPGGDYSTKSGDKDGRRIVMIQSVTELHSAGIKFLPTQGGIKTIHFNITECQFYLPTIKVNVNSEVIFRNLVAYELLTKSDYLIFTRYIELMRAIIDTPDDVKLLVQEGIISTDLTDEVVERLFNGMSKSIRPTKTPVLDE